MWSSNDCNRLDGVEITLMPDGTYVEAGGRGRWSADARALSIKVIEQPEIAFESLYPELMALDDDGRLPFVGKNVVEATSGTFVKLFRRCK